MRPIFRSAIRVLSLIGVPSLLGLVGAIRAAEMPLKIDETTAGRLAAEAVYGGLKYLGSFEPDNNSGPFFVFDGHSSPPREGSFGFYAVNPWTGDVWALWGCHRLSTPALRKSQEAIRQRFTSDELKHYAKLRQLKPVCILED